MTEPTYASIQSLIRDENVDISEKVPAAIDAMSAYVQPDNHMEVSGLLIDLHGAMSCSVSNYRGISIAALDRMLQKAIEKRKAQKPAMKHTCESIESLITDATLDTARKIPRVIDALIAAQNTLSDEQTRLLLLSLSVSTKYTTVHPGIPVNTLRVMLDDAIQRRRTECDIEKSKAHAS